MIKAPFNIKPGRPPKDQPNIIGPLQAEILRKISSDPSDAHGIGIARALRQEFDPNLPDAQVYVALRRLEARGIIELIGNVDTKNSPSVSNGPRGRHRKLYALTTSGKRAISDAAVNSKSKPGQSLYKDIGHAEEECAGYPA